jgi:molybdopterin synthase catalytic subunit
MLIRQHVSNNHGRLQVIQYHKTGNIKIALKYVLTD